MLDNIWEWVRDCWHDNYPDAHEKGDVSREEQKGGDCGRRVIRGGSSRSGPRSVRSAGRDGSHGFRLAQG